MEIAASTSTAIDSNYKHRGDVFINHRGPDAKDTFASHLYHRLPLHGLRGFLDREEMETGQNLTTQIEGAIQKASVHVIIFSKRYAESRWCLDELVLICNSGAPIFPVYYGVKPADLKRTDGVYAQSLRELQERKQVDPTKMKNWREVLSKVAKIRGSDLAAFNG
jgi:hypothetical protein